MVQSPAVSHKHVQKELFEKGGVDVGVSFVQLVRKELLNKVSEGFSGGLTQPRAEGASQKSM